MRGLDNGKYKYIARFVDDVMVFSKDPMAIMKKLEEVYVMKGVGSHSTTWEVMCLNWMTNGKSKE
jgi:hypothetical protein